MQFDLQQIPLPIAVRYLLPGCLFVLLNFVGPMLLMHPEWIALLNGAQLVLLLVASIAVGFMMDSLHVHTWAPKYEGSKAEFFRQLSSSIGINGGDGPVVYRVIRAAAIETPLGRAWAFEQARWMTISHAAKACFAGTFIFLFVGGVGVVGVQTIFGQIGQRTWPGVPFAIGLALAACGVSLERRVQRELEKCNGMLITYAMANRDRLNSLVKGVSESQRASMRCSLGEFDIPAEMCVRAENVEKFKSIVADHRRLEGVEGAGSSTTRTDEELFAEVQHGESIVLARTMLRIVRVVRLWIEKDNRVLIEIEQEFNDARRRRRRCLPAEKIFPGETALDAAKRCTAEELSVTSDESVVLGDQIGMHVSLRESDSYTGIRTMYIVFTARATVDGLPDAAFWRENRISHGTDSVVRHRFDWVDVSEVTAGLEPVNFHNESTIASTQK